MENAWPLWALPFWTMGVPLIWAFTEKVRTPKVNRSSNSQPAARRAGAHRLPSRLATKPLRKHETQAAAARVPKEALLGHKPAIGAAALQMLRHSVPYDVVHANFFMSGWVGMKLRDHLRVPLVMTFHALGLVRREHQGEQETFPEARIGIGRQLVRTAERIVAECPQDKADLMRRYGASPSRIATVPCGVDLAQFAPGSRARARRELGLADDEFIVLQLGRIVPRKGIDNVIRAVARMRPGLRVRLLVVGGESTRPDESATPEIGRLRALARVSGIESRVTFVGQRQGADLRNFYLAADVLVGTPWYEPFGITPLEAMACARPVVGSAVGGIKFSVVDQVTGYHVPARDPEALACLLEQLHDNPALAEAFGLAGARRVRERFTWEQVSQALIEVYVAAGDRLARLPTRGLELVRSGSTRVERVDASLDGRIATGLP